MATHRSNLLKSPTALFLGSQGIDVKPHESMMAVAVQAQLLRLEMRHALSAELSRKKNNLGKWALFFAKTEISTPKAHYQVEPNDNSGTLNVSLWLHSSSKSREDCTLFSQAQNLEGRITGNPEMVAMAGKGNTLILGYPLRALEPSEQVKALVSLSNVVAAIHTEIIGKPSE